MTINATITLKAPFPDGTHGEACTFHMGQFNFKHETLSPALAITAVPLNTASGNIVHAIVNGLDVDFQAVAIAVSPASNVATFTISDGRSGVTPFMVQVTVATRPDLSSIEELGRDEIRTL